MKQYAINYEDNTIIDITFSANSYIYKHYDKANSLEEARDMIKDYWKLVRLKAEHNVKNASKINPVIL